MAEYTRGGLTNKDALRIFIKKFDDFIEKIDSFIPSNEKKISFYKILDYLFISYLLFIGINIIIKIRLFPDERDDDLIILITILVIVLFYLTILICNKIMKKHKITQKLVNLRDELILNINKCSDKSSKYFTNLEEYSGNFYYGYDNCFIQILRNQEWVRIPKNVIVEGDYIKINVGDKSPADVKCVDYRYIPENKKWDFCLKKGEIFKGFDHSFSESHIELFMQNKYDKIFSAKDEWIFEVVNDPFLDTLELYVKNYQIKSKKEKENNKLTKMKKIFQIVIFTFNIILICILIFYVIYNRDNLEKPLRDYFYIMENPLTFFLSFIFLYFNLIHKFLIYWGNAAIFILKNNLFKIFNNSLKYDLKKNSVIQIPIFNENIIDNQFQMDKDYFQSTNFNEFCIKEHFSFYSKFFQEGIDMAFNLLNVMSNLNRICFLDKEGLIFEKEKEVCELAFFKDSNTIEVLNVQSDKEKFNLKENEYYQIEDLDLNKEDIINSLKPIALCSSVIRNPKESDKTNKLIFIESNKIKNLKTILPVSKLSKYSKKIKEKSGYLFSATHEHLRQHFKDCLCILTKSIGFSENLIKSYKNVRNLWHTNFIKFDNLEYENQGKLITENLDETEESIIYETLDDKDNLMNYDDNLGDVIVSSIIQDEISNKLNYFTKGSPRSILNLCENFWNGKNVEPLSREAIQKINSLMQQWQSSNIQPLAFSYKPTRKNIIDILEKYNMDLEISNKSILHILKHNSLPQIFIGIVAMKNNIKNSFQDLLESLNEAGIIFVFFSKEDVKNTKKLADTVLCEYDFNQCISLKPCDKKDKINYNENEHLIGDNEEIKLQTDQNFIINQEGNKYLPSGVEEIKEFLNQKDEVPLQINLFSDSHIDEVIDIMEIYQDYGEVIASFTSTLNNENIPALAISDINFGINLKPSLKCESCNGMRNDFLNKNNSTIFEFLSMRINSIFCPFVLEENTNYSSFTKIISLTRFVNYRIKMILKFYIYLIYYLILLQIPSYSIMSNPILDSYSLIFILFFILPCLLIAMLTVKNKDDHLQIMNSSKRIKNKLIQQENKFVRIIIKFFFILIICGSNIIILNSVYFTKLNDITYFLKNNFILKNKITNSSKNFNYESIPFWNFSYVPFYLDNFYGEDEFEILYRNDTQNLILGQNLTNLSLTNFINKNLEFLNVIFSYVVIWFILVLSFIHFDKFHSIFSFFFFSNWKFILWNLFSIFISSLLFLLRYYMIKDSIQILNFGYEYLIIFILGTFVILIIDHLKKLYVKKKFSNKQKNIKLIIETRLGTYSPK